MDLLFNYDFCVSMYNPTSAKKTNQIKAIWLALKPIAAITRYKIKGPKKPLKVSLLQLYQPISPINKNTYAIIFPFHLPLKISYHILKEKALKSL